ncbi:hypothetical protein GF352_03465 [archaeon]|nr:hypothetical protein [archaeon]
MKANQKDKLFYAGREIKTSNSAGILNWVKYADQSLDYFITKSIGLNGPEGTSKKNKEYWNGCLTREGWSPPVMTHGYQKGLEYYVNRMGLPNPGVQNMIKEIKEYKGGTLLIISLFGNDEELKRMIRLFEKEAGKKITGYEINKSCPNTHACDPNFTSEINKIKKQIKNLRRLVDKKLFVKLSPTVNAADYMKAFKEAGADAVTISNTVPCKVINKYSGKKIITGGLSGRILLEHTLANTQKASKINNLAINFSGGVNTAYEAALAVKAGATTIQLGSVYAGKTPAEIKEFNKEFKKEAYKELKKIKEEITFKEPEWVNNIKWDDEEGRDVLTLINDEHKEYTVTKMVKESSDTSTIIFNKEIKHRAGQYLMVLLWKDEKPMERPFTLSSNNSITVKKRGETSEALCQLKPSDKIYIRGPYGNGYPIEIEGKNVLLVGGGCGTASFPDLMKKVKASYTTYTGYKNENEVLQKNEKELIKKSIQYKGFIGSVFPCEVLNNCNFDYVITCGPEPMMKAVAKEAVKQGVPEDKVLLSLEEIIKCGYGLCYSCDRGEPLCLTGPVTTWGKAKHFYKRDKSGAKK